ncbi:MAG: GNAT family N-acetyltransferase [Flavobacteriaceae bacterium]|nr:MAG: GNAT family N-acetyltransferase [Flavobacteriaceae bacterium]
MDYLLEGVTSNRLLFRKLNPIDFDAWLPFHENPLSTQFWEGKQAEPKIACQLWLDKTFYRYKNKLGGMNALIAIQTEALVGQCGLLVQNVDGIVELEIGYSILPHYWKNGYATEAATKCKQFAFENKLATSLISIIHIDNIPSQKVAINNGMHIEKTTVYKDNPVHIFRVYAQ